jgi:hypothetical protein
MNTSLELQPGTGLSGGAFVASESGNTITLDTGALQATVVKTGFNLFDTLSIGGTDIVAPHQSSGVLGQATDGQLIVVRPAGLSVVVEENGPARAVVRAMGTLMTSVSHTDVLDFTCRITARQGSADLQVDFTVRNATILRPKHVVIEGLGLVVRVLPGSGAMATIARHGRTDDDVHGAERQRLPAPGLQRRLHRGRDRQRQRLPAAHPEAGRLRHRVQGGRLRDRPERRVRSAPDQEGQIPAARLRGPHRRDRRRDAEPEADALLLAGVPRDLGQWRRGGRSLEREDIAPYTFCWRQHESRTVSFSFHKGAAPSPLLASERLDWPVNGRAADYDQYDSSGVFAYRLMTLAEQNELYSILGMNHSVGIVDDALSVTRFLAAHNTGGNNNHDSIERRLAGEWLRQGLGGQWLNGMDLALYKSEWQILRSDDFHDKNDPGATNDQIPHSTKYEGDLEHRYRDGMVLAYYLSGDARVRDALYDEEEILTQLANTAYERSFYQSMKALAAVGPLHGQHAAARPAAHHDGVRVPAHAGREHDGQRLRLADRPRRDGLAALLRQQQSEPRREAARRELRHARLHHGLPRADRLVQRLQLAGPRRSRCRGREGAAAGPRVLHAQGALPLVQEPGGPPPRVRVGGPPEEGRRVGEVRLPPHPAGHGRGLPPDGRPVYLAKGLQQVQAFAAHDQGEYKDNLYLMDSRLDAQHYMAVLRDFMLGAPLP